VKYLPRAVRIPLGAICTFIGVFLFFLPGSILFLIAGLFLLSFDFPRVRGWLRIAQNAMSKGARKLDDWIEKKQKTL